MSKKPIPKNVRITKQVNEKFEKLSVTKSAAINQAIINLHEQPVLMARALEHRLSGGASTVESTRVSYYTDDNIEQMVQQLAGLSRLSAEEVVRLSVEAYVNKL